MASMAHAVINGEAFTIDLAKSRYRKVEAGFHFHPHGR